MAEGRFSRKIVDLYTAISLAEKPKSIPRVRRGAGAKGLGIAYERALAGALKPYGFEHGRWFEFVDANGHGFCSPDLVRVEHQRVVVVEAKLTDGIAARHQLERLYTPVLAHIYKKPVLCIVALRHMTNESQSTVPYTSIGAALAPGDGLRLFHWLGRGPI